MTASKNSILLAHLSRGRVERRRRRDSWEISGGNGACAVDVNDIDEGRFEVALFVFKSVNFEETSLL